MHLLELKTSLAKSLGDLGIHAEYWELERSKFADLAFKAFKYRDLAGRIAEKFQENEFIKEIKISGPYVNLFLDREKFSRSVLGEILENSRPFPNNGKTLVLEHTSVNPTGPIHIGRFRNPVIGDSLRRIYEFLGWKVITQYYVNDVGRQVAMVTLAKKLGIKPDPEIARKYSEFADKQDFQTMFIYVPANKEAEENPEFKRKIDEMMKKAETGNKELLEELRETAEFCLEGQMETLKECGFRYDEIVFESKFLENGKVWEVVEKLKETGRTKILENGALAIDIRDLGSPREATVLLRPDGTSVYLTRDLAFHLEKLEKGDLVINVLGEDHKVEFQELKALLGLLNANTEKLEVVHFSFVNLEGKRMSTRKGEIITLDEVLEEGKEKALKVIMEKNPGLGAKEEVAKLVSLAAIKYALIKQDPMKKITFNWENALNFEGDTGPYLQYAHVRGRGIIRKASEAGKWPRELEISSVDDMEWNLVLEISRFPEVVLESGNSRKPNIIANYAYSLAKLFNEWYHSERVIGSEKESFRLALVAGFTSTLGNALDLLGIIPLERM